jgi:hypothetical protein
MTVKDNYEYDPNPADEVISTGWTQIISRDITLDEDNFVFCSVEYAGGVIDIPVGIRIVVNSTEQAMDYFKPSIANAYRKFTDFGIINAPAEGATYTFKLEARCLSTGQTLKVRRVRLMIMKR